MIEKLALSGEAVTPPDITIYAVHSNGATVRKIRGKEIPPSITAKFLNISMKDRVVRHYKNFDPIKKEPRPVKVFQSLSPHYAGLRRRIIAFLKVENDTDNHGKRLKWCTYQSPSAGLVIKLQSNEYFKDVHIIDDFHLKFRMI